MIRNVFFYAVLPLLVSACGEARDDLELLRGTLNPDAPRFHPRANAVASTRPIPPRLEAGFPSQDLSGVLLLEAERDGVQTWLAADGASITLEDGMLTSAKGFGSGLTASDVHQSAALIRARRGGQVERFHSFLNGNDEVRLRAFRCEITPVGTEELFLLGTPVAAVKLEEKCYGIEKQFENTYWVRAGSAQIIQSSQWTGDFLGNLFMKVVPE